MDSESAEAMYFELFTIIGNDIVSRYTCTLAVTMKNHARRIHEYIAMCIDRKRLGNLLEVIHT